MDLRTFARMPIKAAKDVAKAYKRDQVIIVAWEKKRCLLNVVSYGRTYVDCVQAAVGANKIKKLFGFPDELCHTKPARQIRKEKGKA